jgi:hypothetical protein
MTRKAHTGHPISSFTSPCISGKKVAFCSCREDNVRFYRFACMFVCFRLGLKKLWHNRRSFPRRALPLAAYAANGTVPDKQNLIQSRRRSFTVPCR